MDRMIFKASLILVCITLAFKSLAGSVEEVEIQTSALCYTCEQNLEKTFAFTKGVKDFEVNLKTGLVKVSYNPKKTDPNKIRMAITKAGYDADDLEADPGAFEKLDDCCKLERDMVKKGLHLKEK